MKVQLPFNLLTPLAGTGIAESFALKLTPDRRRTVIEVSASEAKDLVKLLQELEAELSLRSGHLEKRGTRSPVGTARKEEVSQNLVRVRQAHVTLAEHLDGK